MSDPVSSLTNVATVRTPVYLKHVDCNHSGPYVVIIYYRDQ